MKLFTILSLLLALMVGTAQAQGVRPFQMESVDSEGDEECLTYEATGDSFEWQACGGAETNDLEATDPPTIQDTEIYIGTGAGTGAFAAMSGDATMANTGAVTIGNDKILETMLKAVDAAGDEECLTYEVTTGDFEWQTCGAGGNAWTTIDVATGTDPTATTSTDTLQINDTLAIGWGGTVGSPDTLTADFDYTQTRAGDPAFNVSECQFSTEATGGSIICEGTAANTNEQVYTFPAVDTDAAYEICTSQAVCTGYEPSGTYSGVGTCTTQFVRALNDGAGPTCESIVDADVPNDITIDLSTLASTVTVADIGGDTTSFVAVVTDANGSLSVDTDAELTYQATTNALSATTFIGALTGNADTATALAADPSDCGADTFATAIAANGNLTCEAVDGGTGGEITDGSITRADIDETQLSIQEHATDCTALTCDSASAGELCWEQDSNTIYECEDDGTPAWTAATAAGDGVGYDTVEDNDVAETQRAILNLLSGQDITVSCADDAGNTETDCTWAIDLSGVTNGQALYDNSGALGGLSQITYDGSNLDINLTSGDTAETTLQILEVYNNTGSTIFKCSAVYISGFNVGADLPEISIANSTTGATMPAVGLLQADLTTATAGFVVTSGLFESLDTAVAENWTGLEGDSVYVNTSGTSTSANCDDTLTKTRPTGAANAIQAVARIVRVNATTGALVVQGAGRSNDVPNITDDTVWIGSSTNVATEVAIDDTNTAGQGFLVYDTATNDIQARAVDLATADVTGDLGNANLTDALVADTYSSSNADAADTGVLRLGNAEQVCWEASPTGTDACFYADVTEHFQFNGPLIPSGTEGSFAAEPGDSGAIRLSNLDQISWEASPAGNDVLLYVSAQEELITTAATMKVNSNDSVCTDADIASCTVPADAVTDVTGGTNLTCSPTTGNVVCNVDDVFEEEGNINTTAITGNATGAGEVLFSTGASAAAWDATPAIDCTDCTGIPAATDLNDIGNVTLTTPGDGAVLCFTGTANASVDCTVGGDLTATEDTGTITYAVVDDSHNHVITNIDTFTVSELQTQTSDVTTFYTEDTVVPVVDGGTGVSTSTGTVAVVLSTNPVLVTPNIGVATATSVNKVAITAPATSATLAIDDGFTLNVDATTTLNGGTHSGTNTGDQTAGDYLTLTASDIDADVELYTREKCITVEDPVDADDIQWFRVNAVGSTTTWTVTDIVCLADDGTSVVIRVDECDNNGANCAGLDGATTITCLANDDTADDGTLSNATIDDGDWIRLDIGTVTGTTQLSVCVQYTVTD